eukprot:1676597-Pleurochrysis_carterae.AAC.1
MSVRHIPHASRLRWRAGLSLLHVQSVRSGALSLAAAREQLRSQLVRAPSYLLTKSAKKRTSCECARCAGATRSWCVWATRPRTSAPATATTTPSRSRCSTRRSRRRAPSCASAAKGSEGYCVRKTWHRSAGESASRKRSP